MDYNRAFVSDQSRHITRATATATTTTINKRVSKSKRKRPSRSFPKKKNSGKIPTEGEFSNSKEDFLPLSSVDETNVTSGSKVSSDVLFEEDHLHFNEYYQFLSIKYPTWDLVPDDDGQDDWKEFIRLYTNGIPLSSVQPVEPVCPSSSDSLELDTLDSWEDLDICDLSDASDASDLDDSEESEEEKYHPLHHQMVFIQEARRDGKYKIDTRVDLNNLEDYCYMVNYFSGNLESSPGKGSTFINPIDKDEAMRILKAITDGDTHWRLFTDYIYQFHQWSLFKKESNYNPEVGYGQMLYYKQGAKDRMVVANRLTINLKETRDLRNKNCVPIDPEFGNGYIPRLMMEYVGGHLAEFNVTGIVFHQCLNRGKNYPTRGYSVRILFGLEKYEPFKQPPTEGDERLYVSDNDIKVLDDCIHRCLEYMKTSFVLESCSNIICESNKQGIASCVQNYYIG